MQVPLTNETFPSAALLVDVLRTLLNVSMFSHSRAVLSKQFQTTGPLNTQFQAKDSHMTDSEILPILLRMLIVMSQISLTVTPFLTWYVILVILTAVF